MNEITIKVGDFVNGMEIIRIEKDPFVYGQYVLWTNKTKYNWQGDGELIGFRVRKND